MQGSRRAAGRQLGIRTAGTAGLPLDSWSLVVWEAALKANLVTAVAVLRRLQPRKNDKKTGPLRVCAGSEPSESED